MSKASTLARLFTGVVLQANNISSSGCGLLQQSSNHTSLAAGAAWYSSRRRKGSLVVQESTPVMARNLLVDTLNLVRRVARFSCTKHVAVPLITFKLVTLQTTLISYLQELQT
jgi:hypothetical protein